MMFLNLLLSIIIPLSGNSGKEAASMSVVLDGKEYIEGKAENGNYLCVTAAPRIFSICNQRGEFLPTGWHITGEMGGVWMHPIKLMDGFSFSVNGEELKNALSMRTYPFAQQFGYASGSLQITRTDIAIDSIPVVVSELCLRNNSNKNINIDLGTTLKSNLMPTWLSDRMGIKDGADSLLECKDGILLIRDKDNDWFSGALLTLFDTNSKNNVFTPVLSQQGNGLKRNISLNGKLTILAKGDVVVRLYISGSLLSAADVEQNLETASNSLSSLIEQKAKHYSNIDWTAKVGIPDKGLEKAYRWGKYTTEWLVRDVPGMGRGLSAGLPDYPWFFSNDQSLTYCALVGTRDPLIMFDSMRMLLDRSNERNFGRGNIIHEMSTNGQIYATGRMEESQQFIDAIWTVYRWTGDKKLLDDMYRQGLQIDKFLDAHDSDKDLFPEGYGGVEIEGLNGEMIDVACHTAQFYSDMHDMAMELGDTDTAGKYAKKAASLKKKINDAWWCERDKRYYDMLADSATALKLIDSTLKNWTSPTRNKWAIQYLTNLRNDIIDGKYKEEAYDIFFNPATIALTTGVADTVKARAYLKSAAWFCNKYGLYISGISRPDDIHKDEGSVASRAKDGFNYKEAVMPGNTSLLAIAECLYNNADSAMAYIDKLLNNFSFATPGTTYEVSPDYGQFVQAWNVGGINIPIIQHFFGISPMVSHKQIDLRPDMPSAWNKASVSDVLVGNNRLGLSFNKAKGKYTWNISLSNDGWNVFFHLPKGAYNVVVNGAFVNDGIIKLNGKENIIEYNKK